VGVKNNWNHEGAKDAKETRRKRGDFYQEGKRRREKEGEGGAYSEVKRGGR
jgi:hypothetical protein